MRSATGTRFRALAAGLALTISACQASDLTNSRDAFEVEAGFRTSATSYKQGSGVNGPVASIGITLENRFGISLLPVQCTYEAPEWTLERRNGERWEPVATSSCLLVAWAQITISPGTDYHGVVHLASAVQPGTYRLVFGVLEVTADGTRPVVDGRARSNSFVLTD